METIINIAQEWYPISLLAGIFLLLWGGHLLVDGSVAIAKRFGVSTLVIGLTIVAFSTSSPELAFNIISSLNNHGDLSLGNIFGSNIANLGLVLGVGALICKLPVTGKVVKTEFPLLILATGIVGCVCVLAVAGIVTGLSFFLACIFLLGFCFLMWKWFALGKDKSVVGAEAEEKAESSDKYSAKSWVILLLGLLMLVTGGKATEIGAVAVATSFGMSKIVIGGTIVAIATSLPELVTTVIAAKKGHPDLAVGNVVGSNIFNILFVLPITVLVAPGMTIAVPPSAMFYIIVMFIMTVLAWVLIVVGSEKKNIIPKEGALLVGMFIVYLVWVCVWKSS